MNSWIGRPAKANASDGETQLTTAQKSAQLDLKSSPWPYFSGDEIEAVQSVLRSGKVNYWTGEETRAFEREMALMFGARHAIALSSGSVALDVAIAALEIGPGDEVVVSPRSYIASVSSVLRSGAKPVFADVDRDTQNITVQSVEKVLSNATRAVIPVHLAGWPCDMPAIMDLAESRGVFVIEDCAQSHGAAVAGKPVGGFGHIGVFSFCQDKIVTTGGEGGALLTSSEAVWKKVWSYKENGKSMAAMNRTDHPPGFRWVHEGLGSNYRLTEMQAAIGRVQLNKLQKWIDTRRAHARIFLDAFAGLSALRTTEPVPGVEHAYYKFYAFVRPKRLRSNWNRDRILTTLNNLGVPCYSGVCPEIYREKVMQSHLGEVKRLPIARELGENSLMFLVHPTLRSGQVQRMSEIITQVITTATQ